MSTLMTDRQPQTKSTGENHTAIVADFISRVEASQATHAMVREAIKKANYLVWTNIGC